MKKLLLWIFLLTIWHSLLFFEKKLGLSVILFILPTLALLYYVFKKNNKIRNKQGLYWMIPIILLSSTYFLFNNSFFSLLNLFVIPILFTLLYIDTIEPTDNLTAIVTKSFDFLVEPVKKVPNVLRLVKGNIMTKVNPKPKVRKTIKALLIITPIIIVIIILLSSADMIFKNIVQTIIDIPNNFFSKATYSNFIKRVLLGIIIYLYISASINYLLFHQQKEIEEPKAERKDPHTIKLLLLVLNIIYFIFDIIQIKSLFLHSVSSNINYAEYARQGFFQLMLISIINITIILITKKYKEKNSKKDKRYINAMSITMVGLTFIIIISSFLRMNLYEAQFGYTLLRLLVYITLFTEIILLIPTIMYIIKPKLNIVKAYICIIITSYTIINFLNIDNIIATRNIQRYDKKADIDINYLMNNKTDNIPTLVKFYENTHDDGIKQLLDDYFRYIIIEMDSFQEFNLSKYKAIHQLEKFK